MAFKFNPFTGTFDITSSPGGSTTNVQFNDGGNFGGAAQLVYDKTQSFTGVQKTTPGAPLHVAGVSGSLLSAPTSPTATLVEDVAVTTPTSASAAIQYGPSMPSTTATMSILLIDVITNASTSQNTSGGNYTANGQTIYYQLYCYRDILGTKVVNPTTYQFSFTDTINDGTTQFTVDITSITPGATYYDGFILEKSFDGYTWVASVDLATSTSYNDDDFTGTISFEASNYQENGSSWSSSISQYNTYGVTTFRSQSQDTSIADSNSGLFFVLYNSAYGSCTEQGFFITKANSYCEDIGTATSYYDWGSYTSITPYLIFNDYAFPILNTSLTGSTSTTASFNYSGGDYEAVGSYWDLQIWEYRIHPETGEKWFVSSPDSYSLGTDANDSSFFSIGWSCTPGDGDGRRIVVIKDTVEIYEIDEVYSSGTVTGFSSISSRPDITTYTGISRQFRIYGKNVSPTVKYSSGNYLYYFNDTNVAPYFIIHSFPSPGNANYFKVIESSWRNGSIFDQTVTSTFYQMAQSVGDSIVTPSSVGYLSNGSNLNRTYTIYSRDNSYGTIYYSPTGASVTTTDPNDGKNYTVSLLWTTSGAGGYKIKRAIGASNTYQTVFATGTIDTTESNWTDTNTLTPTAAKTTAAIFERNATFIGDVPVLTLRNTGSSKLNRVVLEYSNGAATAAEYGTNSGGDFVIKSSTNNLYVGDYSSPHTILGTASNFNYQGASGSTFWYRSYTTAYLMYLHGDYGTAFFGTNGASWTPDPNCTMYVQSRDGNEPAITIGLMSGATGSSAAFTLRNSSGAQLATLNNFGQLALNASLPSQSHLYIGAGDSTNAQIRLVGSSSLASIGGGITFYLGDYYGGDSGGSMRKFVRVPSSYTAGGFAYFNGAGDLVNGNYLYFNGSLVGFSSTASFGAGMMANIAAKSANYTLSATDYCINVTASGKTMTLPTAVGRTGQIYVIKATYTSSIGTVNTTSSQTIFTTSAVTSVTMNAGDTLRVMSNGSNWIAI